MSYYLPINAQIYFKIIENSKIIEKSYPHHLVETG
jgi:hypothetical protein